MASDDAWTSLRLNPRQEELVERLSRRSMTYDFSLQFFVDSALTPIEDASVEWSERESPFVTVGRLTIPSQDVASPRGQALESAIENWSFDPWHALEEHRPLGDVMRARNVAYRVSTQQRAVAPEPDGSERF